MTPEYRVVEETAETVVYEVNHGSRWEGPHAVTRAVWEAMTWVGPRHAAPGWVEADSEK